VRLFNTAEAATKVFLVDTKSFSLVPNAPFSYWVEEKVRRTFVNFTPFEADGRNARQGLATADDFRFVRCWWEVPVQVVDSPDRRWWPFAKGGAYSPYYADLHLVVNWFSGGKEMAAFEGAVIRNPDFYFRPGLTWSHRSQLGFSPRALPAGAVFGHKGPSAYFSNIGEPELMIGLLSSSSVGHLLGFLTSFGSFDVGAVQKVPIPRISVPASIGIKKAFFDIWTEKRRHDSVNEVSHVFVAPWLGARVTELQAFEDQLAESSNRIVSYVLEKQEAVDLVVEELYGFKIPADEMSMSAEEEQGDEEEQLTNHLNAPFMLTSYLVGVAFGRWAIPVNIDELRRSPADPFAPLPVQAPGAAPTEEAKLYFAEDASGESPLLNSCRVALRQATALVSVDGYEQDLATRLGVPALRDYLSRPAGFFADHLAVYSMSRRKAPVYWPLSTKSGNFTLWVYYPKLDDQSLPKLIADVLSPKIRTLSQEIENRRVSSGGKIGELEGLRLELEEMRTDFLDLIKRGYRPNQNDGVLITACPLAKYFRHAGFRSKLEACWIGLARGDFDWAHLAMSMWPERALQACKKNRSIAIAHGKEELCPAESPKATRGRKKTPPSA
jgi:hypothetical protein